MESASTTAPYASEAGDLPRQLSALRSAEGFLFAMMDERSRRKVGGGRGEGFLSEDGLWVECWSGGKREGMPGDFLAESGGGLTERLLVTQDGEADAGDLVGQSTSGLVVIGTRLKVQCPGPDA